MISEITEIRANSKKSRVAGAVLIGVGTLPIVAGGVFAIADNGKTLATVIGLAIMTLGTPTLATGLSLAFVKKKRELGDEWTLVIK